MLNPPSRAKLANPVYANPVKRPVRRAFFMKSEEGLAKCPGCHLDVSIRGGRISNHRVGTTRSVAYPCVGSNHSTL